MSSLPFISHHLFVAAVRQEDRPSQKPAPARQDHPSVVALEVLDEVTPGPEPGHTRPLPGGFAIQEPIR